VHGSHDAHHLSVGHRLVGPDVQLAIGTRDRDRTQLVGQGVGSHRRVVQEDLPALGDVHDELLFVTAERSRRHLGQVDRNALLEDRRRHHEDDQQHQHHVDERRDVDLRDRVGAGGCLVESHGYLRK